jgi:hypothetical protein
MDRKKLLLSSALIVGAMFVVTACSDDDKEDPYVTVDSALQTTGVSSDLFGGYATIPVRANGTWTATLPEDCEWVTILNPQGKGNGEIELFFEENTAGDIRNTKLSITSGDATAEVTLFQDDTQGGVSLNDDETAVAILAAGHHYVGYGCQLLQYEKDPATATYGNMIKLSDVIINSQAVSKYHNELQHTVINSVTNSETSLSVCQIDSIEKKRDSLGVALSFNVTYNSLKVGLSGKYVGAESRTDQMVRLSTAGNYEFLRATASVSGAADEYAEYLDDVEKASDASSVPNSWRKNLFSRTFLSTVATISKYANDETATGKKRLNSAILSLINTFGTGIITNVSLGGSVALDVYYDSTQVSEVMAIEKAKLTVGYASTTGSTTVDADLEATYVKESVDMLTHSQFLLNVRGGEQQKATAIENALHLISLANDNEKNTTQFKATNTALVEWVNSLSTANVVVLQFDCLPIWSCVSAIDDEAGFAVMDYLQERYPNSRYFSE